MAKFKYRFFTKSRKENGNFYFSEIPTDTEYNKTVGFHEGEFVSPKKFECSLYQKKVSAGLVETNTILVLGDDGQADTTNVGTLATISNNVPDYKDALDASWKLFAFIDTHNQTNLRFYTVDHETGEVVWTDRLLIDIATDNIAFNIGFVGDRDGQYENNVYFCEIQTTKNDPSELTGFELIEHVGTITVYSTAIGEDERYRTLFENFGIPDPISYMDVFNDETKEEHDTATNDANMNYDTLNKRSKQLFLSYDQIFPFVGTYKALINAVDLLGYDDIYFKEWYRELSEIPGQKAQLVAYNIDYKNGAKSLLSELPLEKRILLKKTNWLSMIYRISEEVLNDEGDIEYEVLPDNVCFPLSKTNYDIYNSDEILVKLICLKRWLEDNIIGIHCRIIEIGGEGIVFERYKDKIYGKVGQGLEMYCEESLTPYLYKYTGNIELAEDGADIRIGIKELEQDPGFTDRVHDITARLVMSSTTAVLGANDTSLDASIDDLAIVDMPIIVADGEIFFDPKVVYQTGNDMTSNFIKLPSISIESARLRDPNKEWNESICYEISNSYNGNYDIIEYVNGVRGDVVASKNEYIYLRPSQYNTPSLRYSSTNAFNVPLFMMSNFYDYSIGDIFDENKEYVLEILDGKMSFIGEYVDKYGETITRTIYLNFHFDTDANEQSIEVNYEYSKNALSKDLIDPTTGVAKCITINVKNTGDYKAYVYGIDDYGTIYGARCPQIATVVIPTPKIILYSTTKETNNAPDFYLANQCAEEPIPYSPTSTRRSGDTVQFKDINPEEEYKNGSIAPVSRKNYLISDVDIEETREGGSVVKYATYPSLSYAADTPKEGDIAHFVNIVDKFEFDHKDGDKIYIRKSGSSSSKIDKNTLDTGVHKNAKGEIKSTELVQKANLVVYDNLHNTPVIEQNVLVIYDSSIDMPYITFASEDASGSRLWYKESDNGLYKKVMYKNITSFAPVSISQNVIQPSDQSYSIDDIMQMSNTFTTYLQAIYELAFEVVDNPNGKNTLLRLKSGQGKIPNVNGVKIFYEGQVVELKQSYYLGTSEISKTSTSRILNVTQDTIEVDAPFRLFPASSTDSSANNTIYVSHAHQAFVDYIFNVENTIECKNGVTQMFVKDDMNLAFVDNTFSIYTIQYDVNDAQDMWTDSHTLVDNGELYPIWVTRDNQYIYRHDIPFTINIGESVVVNSKYMTQGSYGAHYQWRVYMYDAIKDANVVMLESWNDTLFLTPTKPGIYSISLRVFDDYGNDNETIREGAFKVI